MNKQSLLDSLVSKVFRLENVNHSAQQKYKDHFTGFAVKILSTSLTTNSDVRDELYISNAIKSRIQQKPEKERLFLELQQKLSLLMPDPVLRLQVMKLLLNVSKLHSQNTRSEFLEAGKRMLHIQGSIPSSIVPATQRSTPQGGSKGYTVTYPPSASDSSMHSEPSSLNATMSSMDFRGALQSHPGAHGYGSDSMPTTLATTGQRGATAKKESMLVRDILYASQGINGKQLHYVSSGIREGYEVPPLGNPCIEMACNRLVEVGWLFKRVQRQMEEFRNGGCVRQALSAALSAELADYFRLIAVLEEQSKTALPEPGLPSDSQPYLSLMRTTLWLGEPMRRLSMLAYVGDACQTLEGGQLAGVVASFTACGAPRIVSTATRLLDQVALPLLSMIKTWVFEGRLEDPHNEFFIYEALPKSNRNTCADLWANGYALRPAHVPPFVPPPLAAAILRTGKSITFLREWCDDADWVMARAATGAEEGASLGQGLGFNQVDALGAAVAAASRDVDERLLHLLRTRCQLGMHLNALRSYLLLLKGDFVAALMDQVWLDLERRAGEVNEFALNHKLKQAIHASNAKYDDEEVQERLRIKKATAAGGSELAWDVFSLSYEISGPLVAVFTPEAMSQYSRMSVMLWQLKRAERSLGTAWQRLSCEVLRPIRKLGQGAEILSQLAHRMLHLRSEMSHFVNNLQYYLLSEVMEAASLELEKKMANAADLDELIAAHNAYLTTLVTKALLNSEDLQVALRSILNNMVNLKFPVRRIVEMVRSAEAHIMAASAAAVQRTAAGGWGSQTASEATDVVINMAELREVERFVNEQSVTHQEGVETFTHLLPAQAHDEVRFLLYRLDFSEFYNRRRTTASGDSDNDDR